MALEPEASGNADTVAAGTQTDGRGEPSTDPAATGDDETEVDEDRQDGKPPRSLLAGGLLLADRYRVVRHLGSGGMGDVYLAEHTEIGKRVAVKTLGVEYASRKVLRDRFLREARAASSVRHGNIVDITDFGRTEDGTPFYVMEYLEGEDLKQTILREGRLPWRRVRHLAIQVCRALQSAHDAGVIHRDIKPDNCFRVERDGDPDAIKVVDFGIAKVVREDETTELTKTGMIVGTAAYMSPEQARSEELDGRTDVYSLGVVLFRMMTGHLPFEAKSVMGMLTRHVTTPPPPASLKAPDAGIAPEVDALIDKALAKKPEDRYQSAAEFAEAIAAIPADVDSSSVSVAAPKVVQGPSRVPLVAGVAVLVAVASVAGWAMTRPGHDEAAAEPPPDDVGMLVPPVETPVSTTIALTITGVPTGARLFEGELELGVVDAPIELSRGDESRSFRVVAEGYRDDTLTLVPSQDLEVNITMVPAAEAADAAVPDVAGPPAEEKGPAKKKSRPAKKIKKAKKPPEPEVPF